MDKAQKKKDAKERKKEEKDRKKEEMNYYRSSLNELLKDERRSQLAFPPTLNTGQRKKLHTYAHSIGLKSKSTGKGDDRFLIVYKKTAKLSVPTAIGDATTCLRLSDHTVDILTELIENDPVKVSDNESIILQPAETNSHAHLPFMFGDSRSKTRVTVPPQPHGNESFRTVRQSLPIFDYRDVILDAIHQHQVVVISGETGSGKTTQVPQYIMEDSAMRSKGCRIICTQPRRLAATSIALRVSQERNDTVGKSVGYQIRLDSRVTQNTNLIFTTSGFLLRCLTGSKKGDVFKNLTHLILDEVHEREKVTDFLLIAIKDALKENPHLKVILMSATLDSEQFSRYFNECPVINVPGRLFDVEIFHLGDILMATEYKTKHMIAYMSENQGPKILRHQDAIKAEEQQKDEANDAPITISEEDVQFYDECFDECLSQDEDDPFEQIFCLITDENMPVDYMHSTKFRTALGISAEKGFDNVLTRLLSLGANPTLPDGNGKTASDYAVENEREECVEILAHYQHLPPIKPTIADDGEDTAKANALQQFTLMAYQMTNQSMKWNEIDHELLLHVILHIHAQTSTDGSILVFLPGYEDIMTQKDLIEKGIEMNNYHLFVLHSGVNGISSTEQARVFDRMPQGIRKIILSTNIAETSLTIDDVVYVVDAGKVKQLSYDSISESTCLTSTDISQACAKQRAGRAGRIQNGFCYRLYSLEQYEAMEKFTLPEILRVPLTEICLNSKMLAGDLSIEAFLLKALQAPAVKNIRQSIELLKKINALDEMENITYLGIHLANMPVDCQLGKMILYSIMLRCLDPVVTIVSALSVKDPFMLPLGNEGEKITEIKRGFARNSLSDHQMLLNTYDEWSNQKSKQHAFCSDNYISNGNMQMIHGIRRLIMGHLKMAEFVAENTARNYRKLNENSLNWEIVKACLTAGGYPNVCRVTEIGGIYSKQDKKLLPHMSSILRDRKTRRQIDKDVFSASAEFIIHGEKSRIKNLSLISHISVVPSIDIGLFAGPITLPESNLIEATTKNQFEMLSDADCDDIPVAYIDEEDEFDLDDELYGEDAFGTSESVLKIDDWISFLMDPIEANLLFQLRQKFATMFIKFLKNPTGFQMTNKESSMLEVLLMVIKDEDDIEMHIKRKIAREATDAADNVERLENVPASGRNQRKLRLELPTGPAINSEIYNQAIEPEHHRNKKNKKKSRGKKKQTNGPKLAPFVNLNQINHIRQEFEGPSTSSVLTAQQQLTQGLFNPTDTSSESPSLQNSDISVPANNLMRNRYFVLTVKQVGILYESCNSQNWKFKTPLVDIRKAARESDRVYLFFVIKSTIWGCGEFRTKKAREYSILMADHMKNFKPLTGIDANSDHELDAEQGFELYNKVLEKGLQKRTNN